MDEIIRLLTAVGVILTAVGVIWTKKKVEKITEDQNVKLDEIHVLVNSKAAEAVAEIAELKRLLEESRKREQGA